MMQQFKLAPPKFKQVRMTVFLKLGPPNIELAVVTTMSVLSAISTGFWSRLGDSYGRKLVLSIFLIGALLMSVMSIVS
jgi:MFS family permease